MERDQSILLVLAFMIFVTVERVLVTFRRRPAPNATRFSHNSFFLLLLTYLAVIGGAVFDWSWRNPVMVRWVSVLGIVFYVVSVILRRWAIKTLGEYFSVHVEIQNKHPLVTKGIYSWVRHPIYVAVICEMLSIPLILNSWWALSGTVFVYIPLLVWRLKSEEQVMINHFGDAYRSYQQRTGALWPKLSTMGKRCESE